MIFRKKRRDVRCSFCNKSHRDVLKLVSGPSVSICNECTAICSTLVAEDQKAELREAVAKGEALACRLCEQTQAARHLLHVPNRGPVCYTCVAAIKVAAGREWEFHAPDDE